MQRIGCNLKSNKKIKECREVRLYYLEDHSKSQMAIECLKNNNINFDPIEVNRYGIAHLLERDLGTSRVPTLFSCNRTYVGLEGIQRFVNKK